MHRNLKNALAWLLAPAALLVAGCGGRVSASDVGAAQNLSSISIQASETRIDTNRTTRYSATLADGEPASVEWSVSGGDPTAGPGSISREGVYTPPSYLTQDAVTVRVSAVLTGRAAQPSGNTALTVTPGFLQPLTPANLSLGANGSVTISGSMTEVGGTGGMRFALASNTAGTPSIQGTLSAPRCVRGSVGGSNPAYTVCSVTYTAPAVIPASDSVYILGTVASNPTLSWTRVLLNAAGISSNPAEHQTRLAVPVPLGSSSGSNMDYDASRGQLTDCCGGTLGALLQDTSGNQFVLSNNHVFARSDQSIPGETIIQPGLIDNGCTPYGVGPGTNPVATLTGYPALSSPSTNVDAAIARVTPGLVDPRGSILELGTKQPDGTLAAAAPGISSTAGKGEAASLGMMVAKSGRTTGLTCAAVSAVDVDVVVDYFTDCAETTHSMTKTFTNQIAIAGTSFSDAGDSGALVVDAADAEPVGLFFAGGTDINGVEQAIASPAGDVLAELNSQVPESGAPTTYSFVGGVDHPVSCLSYDGANSQEETPGKPALPAAERERVEAALAQAQLLINPANGIVRAGIVASKDHPGQGAIALFVEPVPATNSAASAPAIPASVGGVPTVVLPVSGPSGESAAPPVATQPKAASLNQVLAIKQKTAASLLKSHPALFGVGVGQSLDNPSDAALILFVDRKKITGSLPDSPELAGGVRVRYILMDRLHVTRSHGFASGAAAPGGACFSSRRTDAAKDAVQEQFTPRDPDIFENQLNQPE
ncbi:hypothetical protein [Acidicapsa acidisoli]|uniref:hypothetical protein n=1 Tax=Acidicapsa acidisoli TaxID=1615681 RepID=UPI0021DF8452|nr:hypothetical protein [Acidicapsa acidisoli]